MTPSWLVFHGCIGAFWFFIGRVAASSPYLEDSNISVQEKRRETSNAKWWLRTVASAPLLPLFMGWMQIPRAVDDDGIVNEGYDQAMEYHWPVWLWYAFCALVGGLVRVTSYHRQLAKLSAREAGATQPSKNVPFQDTTTQPKHVKAESEPIAERVLPDHEDPDERWKPEWIKDGHRQDSSEPQSQSNTAKVVHWADPELQALEREIERLTSELADLQAEQAELSHQIARFHGEHHRKLGERLKRVLELRLKLKEWIAKRDPQKVEEVKKARDDYEGFRNQQAAKEAEAARTDWQLSKDEERELKRLFRAGSKKCHPDVVPEEHTDAAAAMFRQLNDAYERGDLAAVRRYATQAESGIFQTESSGPGHKEALGARRDGLRDALAKAAESVTKLKTSATYHVMLANENWDDYFTDQAHKLDAEIERLKDRLTEEELEARYAQQSRE